MANKKNKPIWREPSVGGRKVALITGMSGFIGKHLADALFNKGYKVVGLDRALLSDPQALENELFKIKPNEIYHLAAFGNHFDQIDEDEIIGTNIMKTYLLLRALKNVDFDKFINFSSSSIYGEKSSPMFETSLPETTTFYGVSKVASEYLCKAFAKNYNKRIITIRPFSVYGEGEADFRFIPKVCEALREDKKLNLVPHPVHDWIYIPDFIDGVLKVAHEEHTFDTVNIGTGESHTNNDIVHRLELLTEKKAKTILKSTIRQDDKKEWKAENSRLKSLGWKPQFTLIEGLSNTYEFYANEK